MSASSFLVQPSFQATWLEPYWKGLSEGALYLPKCSVCGEWEWYPQEGGPGCPGGHYIWNKVSPWATVFTFTEVNRPLLEGVSKPYITGLVTPKDAPSCRIATQLVPTNGKIYIGASARLSTTLVGDSIVPFFKVEVGK